MLTPILTVECDEPEGKIDRTVYQSDLSVDDMYRLYEQASKFPYIYAREFSNKDEFISLFFHKNSVDLFESHGILYIIDDFIGTLFLCNINWHTGEGDIHYSFFDKRLRGRVLLIEAVCRHVFDVIGLERLNVVIPEYVPESVRGYIELCGFKLEGRKRKAMIYKGKRYDLHCFGRLKEDK
jgi:RimJ/RimL family protein N-acetyltransferase